VDAIIGLNLVKASRVYIDRVLLNCVLESVL